jgi:hypothetical protein
MSDLPLKDRILLTDIEKSLVPWGEYWRAAKMVNLEAITSFEAMRDARRWCGCMSMGVMENVTDLQMWRALQFVRPLPAEGV